MARGWEQFRERILAAAERAHGAARGPLQWKFLQTVMPLYQAPHLGTVRRAGTPELVRFSTRRIRPVPFLAPHFAQGIQGPQRLT